MMVDGFVVNLNFDDKELIVEIYKLVGFVFMFGIVDLRDLLCEFEIFGKQGDVVEMCEMFLVVIDIWVDMCVGLVSLFLFEIVDFCEVQSC